MDRRNPSRSTGWVQFHSLQLDWKRLAMLSKSTGLAENILGSVGDIQEEINQPGKTASSSQHPDPEHAYPANRHQLPQILRTAALPRAMVSMGSSPVTGMGASGVLRAARQECRASLRSLIAGRSIRVLRTRFRGSAQRKRLEKGRCADCSWDLTPGTGNRANECLDDLHSLTFRCTSILPASSCCR